MTNLFEWLFELSQGTSRTDMVSVLQSTGESITEKYLVDLSMMVAIPYSLYDKKYDVHMNAETPVS